MAAGRWQRRDAFVVEVIKDDIEEDLGLAIEPLASGEGVYVVAIRPTSAVARQGILQVGDVLTGVNNHSLATKDKNKAAGLIQAAVEGSDHVSFLVSGTYHGMSTAERRKQREQDAASAPPIWLLVLKLPLFFIGMSLLFTASIVEGLVRVLYWHLATMVDRSRASAAVDHQNTCFDLMMSLWYDWAMRDPQSGIVRD